MYGLQSACLNKSERRRLDGFQARCLRRVLRIPPSFYSRVSNRTVLESCGQKALSARLLQQQMIYMGALARRGPEDPVRASLFEPGSINLRQPSGPRRVGRPRLNWGKTVFEAALQTAGSMTHLKQHFTDSTPAWKAAVRACCV